MPTQAPATIARGVASAPPYGTTMTAGEAADTPPAMKSST